MTGHKEFVVRGKELVSVDKSRPSVQGQVRGGNDLSLRTGGLFLYFHNRCLLRTP